MKTALLIAIFFSFAVLSSKSQTDIPNGGFENWTSMGNYFNPDLWGNLNDMTASANVFTCVKGTPGNPGSSYIKLVSKNISGMGVVPGIAVSGSFDQTSMQPLNGFPYSDRPESLTGKWQHMIFGSDQGYIDVVLTRWDEIYQIRIPVATAHKVLTGMAMSWTNFTIPLNYTDGGYPDSCMIVLSASGDTPANNDYLYIDNLAFTGMVTGIEAIGNNENISVYPNPSGNTIYVDLTGFSEPATDIVISDMSGKIVKSIRDIASVPDFSIDISELPQGSYLLKVSDLNRSFASPFIKR